MTTPKDLDATGRTIAVAMFNSAYDTQPKAGTMAAAALLDVLKRKAADSLCDVATTEDVKKQGAAFAPCLFKPGTTRLKANVEHVSAFVADIDNASEAVMASVFDALAALGITWCAWTTWGSGWAKLPSGWRVVVPFARDVPAELWPAVWHSLNGELVGGRSDQSTKDAGRLHYLPRTPRLVPDGNGGARENTPSVWREAHGELFDPLPMMDAARAAAPLPLAGQEGGDPLALDFDPLNFDPLALDFDPAALDRPRPSGNRPDAVERARAWANQADPALAGQGGSATAMRVVGSVVRGFDLTDGEARAALAPWNARCVPPWSVAELDHKISDAQATPDPQGRARGWLLPQDRERPRAPTGTGSLALPTAAAAPSPPPPPVAESLAARIGPPPAGAFMRTPTRREYLVEQVHGEGIGRHNKRGIIGRGQLHLLAGEGGAGKGRWVTTIATAMAASKPSFDQPTTPEKPLNFYADAEGTVDACGLKVHRIRGNERVLLLLGEDDAIDFHDRLYGAAEALGDAFTKNGAAQDLLDARLKWATANGMVFSIAEPVSEKRETTVHPSEGYTELVDRMRSDAAGGHPWALIVLDPLARFSGVPDNDNTAQHQVMALAEKLLDVNGPGKKKPAVLVVDHVAKPGKDVKDDKGKGTVPTQHDIRGASAKVNAARVAMVMVPGGGDSAVVDREGRTAIEPGFDDSEVAKASVGDVVWHMVKNNGEKKADPVELDFTKHGGLKVGTPEDARERRKRQWHAAKLLDKTTPKKKAGSGGGNAAKGAAAPEADDDTDPLGLA